MDFLVNPIQEEHNWARRDANRLYTSDVNGVLYEIQAKVYKKSEGSASFKNAV